jgi:type VI secretion system secreted protein VgrG
VSEFPENEIFLEHLYHDNTPLAGAPYTLTLSDGKVIEGTLDACGQARVKLPPGVTAGTVEYGQMPGKWEIADKTPNPDAGSVDARIDKLLNKYGGASTSANQTPTTPATTDDQKLNQKGNDK